MIEAAIDNWLSRGMPSVHGQISNLKNQKSKITPRVDMHPEYLTTVSTLVNQNTCLRRIGVGRLSQLAHTSTYNVTTSK